MNALDRFYTAATRAEMARIDEEWCDARQRSVRNALMALLSKALDVIDAGQPEPAAHVPTMRTIIGRVRDVIAGEPNISAIGVVEEFER